MLAAAPRGLGHDRPRGVAHVLRPVPPVERLLGRRRTLLLPLHYFQRLHRAGLPDGAVRLPPPLRRQPRRPLPAAHRGRGRGAPPLQLGRGGRQRRPGRRRGPRPHRAGHRKGGLNSEVLYKMLSEMLDELVMEKNMSFRSGSPTTNGTRWW